MSQRPLFWKPTALGLAAAIALAVPGMARAEGLVINRIVATVDGEPITAFELERSVRMNSGGADPSRLTEKDYDKALDVLIGETLVRLESGRLGLNVSKEDVDAYINEIKKSNKLDDAQLAQALAQQGFTIEGYKVQIRKEMLKNQLVSKQIRQKVNITEADIQNYYDEHKDDYAHVTEIHVRDIFFMVPPDASQQDVDRVAKRVQDAMAKLQQGQDFKSVARQYSDLSPETGGELGWMKKGEMQPELEQLAFSLKKGQASSPVRTGTGVHILMVDDTKAGSYTPLPEVRDNIQERLYAQAVNDRFQEWVDKDLVEGHEIIKKPFATVSAGAPDASSPPSDAGDQPG